MWAVVMGAAVTGLSTVLIAIYSQWTSSCTTLKSKTLDNVFPRKADAYKEVMQKAWDFGTDPKDTPKFFALRSAIYSALIVATKDVADALDDNPRTNLHMAAALLRTTATDNPEEIPSIQMHQWREAMEQVKKAIQSDMVSLSQPLRIRDVFRFRL